ncbi:hypothetical protein DPMN_001932 [Dreissena polymorpha]|uniref:Uncharacterized protein n=1 Tax=Dreissena polymorpha TaxID=45954 RepID=A0A9D4MM71_DREPO|nr:hypothetical protein DPMN_001932 [Dreissena polymorpha]
MTKVPCIAIFLATLVIVSYGENGYSRLVQQKPLLFGRRGMSPNMNSLFFGKRASAPTAADLQLAYDDDEMCSLCRMVQPTCRQCYKDEFIAMGMEEEKRK